MGAKGCLLVGRVVAVHALQGHIPPLFTECTVSHRDGRGFAQKMQMRSGLALIVMLAMAVGRIRQQHPDLMDTWPVAPRLCHGTL